MNIGKVLRLKNIWKRGRAVIIPFDHGQYGGVPKGLEDPRRLTERIASTEADAVLVTPGTLALIAGALEQLGVILRLDGGFTKYTPQLGDYEEVCSVPQAVRLGADAGIIFTFVGTGFDAQSLARLGRTAMEADAWGFPLISEVLPPALLNNHFERRIYRGRKRSDVTEETINVSRIAAEHGADIIKTRYSGSIRDFRRVVLSCGAKVIVAGGPKADRGNTALLQFAHDCVQAGASGIVFGRNVWQHPKMEKLIASLCAIVHHGEPVAKAVRLLR